MTKIDPSEAASFLGSLPLCMVSLNAADLHPVAINDMFEKCMGPLYKFQESDFCLAASDEKGSDARARFRAAIEQAIGNERERVRVRNVEMLTLGEENSGFPIRRFFDWFISVPSEGTVLLLGDPCTEQDVTQREKDAELIDFFQNAPIALHWLSGEGKVMWANQTELNVLGYTAEEYIGQDIMKFCPDEKELVLEIFKQLGSGNTIKDVPVRFRTKDGKLVHLLIDSNVRYEKDGSFGHTRCFIRDDTGRKIRESRAQLMLEETKRSLSMLDNFMARSLHHLRTPLHVTQNMVDAIALYFRTHVAIADEETKDCVEMVRMANEQISRSVAFLDDIADLAKFDQGAVLHIHPQLVDLEDFGKQILRTIPTSKSGVRVLLKIRQDQDMQDRGPGMAVTDPIVLRRALMHLLTNAADVTDEGTISLGIGYKNNRLTFSVCDTGPGLEMPMGAAEGDLPIIFQRYHQELVPEETLNLTIATSLRKKIEASINTHKRTGMGIGLSLTYHLVQALGGEIRCTSQIGEGTNFQFSLPRTTTFNVTVPASTTLVSMTVNKADFDPPQEISQKTGMLDMHIDAASNGRSSDQSTHEPAGTDSTGVSSIDDSTGRKPNKRARDNDVPSSFHVPKDILPDVPAYILASQGVKSQDPPSVLVVEDTKTCAKMLCRILSRFNCATKWAENGKVAVDILKEATPGTYDLILMDLRMPVMDGLEATNIIKGELGISTPVVALTGDDNEKMRETAKTIGFDAFHGKPMKRCDLKAVIKRFTGYEVK